MMTRTKFYLLILTLLYLPSTAATVSWREAMKKAKEMMPEKTFIEEARMSDGNAGQKENSPFYIFNAKDDGFVIVSGDDRVPEILGYSYAGNLDLSTAPDHVKWLLGYYEEAIKNLAGTTAAGSRALTRATKAAIAPMVTTQWGQGAPYNDQCPVYDNQKCLTGCVATAMAQIINYFKWPQEATGSVNAYTTTTNSISVGALGHTSFDWNNMGDTDIARLMRYCGQSVQMDYGLDASGATADKVPSALTSIFGYAEGIKAISKDAYTDDWTEMLYEELQNGRPILYGGSDGSKGGHMFVLHGYKDGKFYINWGWKGDYDGYYEISLLNPESFNFQYTHSAVVGIQIPPALDEDQIVYRDYDRHLTFILDPNTKEAKLGTGKDLTMANAKLYPPIGDTWWNEQPNLWEDITIPSTITYKNNVYTVTSVATHAFYKETDIKRITLPETIKSIGSNAFYWCVNLESINIPTKVKKIESGTFVLCRKLTSIRLPEELESIGASAFSDCEGLTEMTIPGSCLTIGRDAFKWCKSMRKLILEDGTEPLDVGYAYDVGIDYYPQDIDKKDLQPHNRGAFADCLLEELYLGRNLEYPSGREWNNTNIIRPLAPFQMCKYNGTWRRYDYEGPHLYVTFGDTVTEIPDSLFYGRENYGDVDFEALPKNLKKIGKMAFTNILQGQKLILPSSVTSIGEAAFENDRLETLVLPESLHVIEASTFAKNNLTEVVIPATVTEIAKTAFSQNNFDKVYCNPQTPPAATNPFGDAAIYVAAGCGTTYRSTWTGNIFDPEGDALITINVKKAGSLGSRLTNQYHIQPTDVYRLKLTGSLNDDDINILKGMTNLYDLDMSELAMEEIPNALFKGNAIITSIILPNALKKINEESFSGCWRLTGAIGNISSCTSIGYRAFYNTNITGLNFADAITIGTEAFTDCAKLENIVIPQGAVVGERAFASTGIKTVTVNKDAEIGAETFTGCRLDEVILNDGVKNLGDDAFGTCINTIRFNGSIQSIGKISAKISSVHVPDILSWCQLPFTNIVNISSLYLAGVEAEDIVIPGSVKQVRDGLFYGSLSIKTVRMEEGITTLGNDAFADCVNLRQVSLPNSLESIPDRAFTGCSSLEQIQIPGSVSSIGKRSFLDCIALQKIDIPATVSSIGLKAFEGCSALSQVHVHWESPAIDPSTVFTGISANCDLYVPINCYSPYYNAGWNSIFNINEAGILTISVTGAGSVNCLEQSIRNGSATVFFTPYNSFYVSFAPDNGAQVVKVRMNDTNVLSEVTNNQLFIDEPEENMSLSVYFSDNIVALGDVNGDGVVSQADADATANYILKNPPATFYEHAADVNDDGVINITDVIIIVSELITK